MLFLQVGSGGFMISCYERKIGNGGGCNLVSILPSFDRRLDFLLDRVLSMFC
jgi:hypothetical protein